MTPMERREHHGPFWVKDFGAISGGPFFSRPLCFPASPFWSCCFLSLSLSLYIWSSRACSDNLRTRCCRDWVEWNAPDASGQVVKDARIARVVAHDLRLSASVCLRENVPQPYSKSQALIFCAVFFCQKPGNHPNFAKKTLSEWKGHSWSNSRNSRAFLEQFSEWQSRPNLCENAILGATLGATLRIGWTPKFQPKFSERFFFLFKIGVVPARQTWSLLSNCASGGSLHAAASLKVERLIWLHEKRVRRTANMK